MQSKFPCKAGRFFVSFLCLAHCALCLREHRTLFSRAHCTRYIFIRFWYETPVSSARDLKYSIAPLSRLMVTGFFCLVCHGRNSFSSPAVIAGQSSVGVGFASCSTRFSSSVSGGCFFSSSDVITVVVLIGILLCCFSRRNDTDILIPLRVDNEKNSLYHADYIRRPSRSVECFRPYLSIRFSSRNTRTAKTYSAMAHLVTLVLRIVPFVYHIYITHIYGNISRDFRNIGAFGFCETKRAHLRTGAPENCPLSYSFLCNLELAFKHIRPGVF